MGFEEPILHVDMDAFFVEVERLRDPELRGRPVAVGGSGLRSVVAAASYEARAFGVRSAMPSVEARRRCPTLEFVPPDHDEYGRVSEEVFSILRSFTPMVEGVSVDEAFLDVSGLRFHHESALHVAEAIRTSLRAELGLPSSVGIADSKFVAKLASKRAKPDGTFLVAVSESVEFLHALPIGAVWGVGRSTEAALAGLGVETVADLASTPTSVLSRALGPAVAHHLEKLAAGHDHRPVVPDSDVKSTSVEMTFDRDLRTVEEVIARLRRQSDEVTRRLRRAGHAARTVSIKMRASDFTTITRSETLASPTDVDVVIFEIVSRLARAAFSPARPVRLIGIGLSQLVPSDAPVQMSVGEDSRWRSVAAAVEDVRDRFGDGSVFPASARFGDDGGKSREPADP